MAERAPGAQAGGLDAGRGRRALLRRRLRRPRVRAHVHAAREPVLQSRGSQVDPGDGGPVRLRARRGRCDLQHPQRTAGQGGRPRRPPVVGPAGNRPEMNNPGAVPLLDLKAQYAPIRDEVLAAIARVCDSQQFVLGAEVDAFEREVAASLDVGYAVSVSSGTDAILALLMAL